jgi:signal transduction histidine kinase
MGHLLGGAVTLASGLGTLALRQHSEGPLTTYAGRSGLAATAFVAAGLALALAGLVASATTPTARVGDLALLAGFLWFAPAWVGWDRGPSLVRSLGAAAAAFLFPVVVHLVLDFPGGRARERTVRVLAYAVYAEAGLAALGAALFRDPFLDPGCWANCTDNVFLVTPLPHLAHTIQVIDRWFVAAAAGGLAAVCLWRMAAASGAARRELLPVAGPGILLTTPVIAHSVRAQGALAEDPSDLAFFAILLAGCATTTLLAAGLVWAAVRTRRRRRAVTRLAASLGGVPVPGALASALARAIGDPDLRIAYWRPDSDGFVDAQGRPVPEPHAGPGRTLTTLVRGGHLVAVVSHTAEVADLEREIGAAIRLGLENERLQAEVLAQLEELRTSRARIVETGDAERRGLERDLHDGAQQRLLALSYDIRLAGSAAHANADPATATLLEGAVGEGQAALEELRELAHGIYPAVLGAAGLAPALATFADESPVEVDIQGTLAGRFTASVETAAYVVVVEAVADAVGRGAGHAVVCPVQEAARLLVTVDDDGAARVSSMVQLADRVGAIGGTLRVEPRRIRAEIPCA